MERIKMTPRDNWVSTVENLGFEFHTLNGHAYWDESACYRFHEDEIETLEEATTILWEMCLEAVDWVIRNDFYQNLGIDSNFAPLIEKSFRSAEQGLYGRFDFCWNGENEPKLLEFNADTPTSLFEASVIQWQWLEESFPQHDQFNSIHEKLVDRWREIAPSFGRSHICFTSVGYDIEDDVTTCYLSDTCSLAGFRTKQFSMEDIGWNGHCFTDPDSDEIRYIFKLYPWEWMMKEEFSKYLGKTNTRWIEPAWKVLLSSKGILPVLWKLFPNHPNLLPSYFSPKSMTSWVQKPLFSREGANILIFDGNREIRTDGPYKSNSFIYQQFSPLPDFSGFRPVIGSWIVGDHPAGIGIREDTSLITNNLSRFVPHYLVS